MSYLVNAYNQIYQLNFGDVFTDDIQYAICVGNDLVIHLSQGEKNTIIKRCRFSDAFINSYQPPYKDKRYENITKDTYQILHQMLISEDPALPISPHILFRDCHSVIYYIMTWTQKISPAYIVFSNYQLGANYLITRLKKLPIRFILIPTIITGFGLLMKLSVKQILGANIIGYLTSIILLN